MKGAVRKEIYFHGPVSCRIDVVPLLTYEPGIIETSIAKLKATLADG